MSALEYIHGFRRDTSNIDLIFRMRQISEKFLATNKELNKEHIK